MTLAQLIKDNKEEVVTAWYDAILRSYPQETQRLWKANTNQFTNPVGASFTQGLARLVDELIVWQSPDRICEALSDIIKIRAVQDFTPGKALAFVFSFKKIVRERFEREVHDRRLHDELSLFDSRVDNLSLLAFDIFVKQREQIYAMRVEEFKNRHHMLFRKAGIQCADAGEVLGLSSGGSTETSS